MIRTTCQLTELIGRLARAIWGVVAEWNYATRRMTELAVAPDRYVLNPERAPATYAEFLFRTSGVLVHEPSARARAGARR
jgi:hypothetical protein